MTDTSKPMDDEEFDFSTVMPPSDPALYDAWRREQIEIGMKEANDPNTVMIPHETVFRELREKLQPLLEKEQREKERNAA